MIETKIDEIIRGNNVLIYGKGKVGKLFFQWLKLHQIDNVSGFVVSGLDDEMICMGKPVIEVGEVKQKFPDAIIIVCVGELYRQEVIQTLKEYNVVQYIALSDEMIESFSKNVLRLEPRKSLKYEVHITEHCNLNCRGCFHCSPLAKEEFLSVEEYEKDCNRLSELYQGNMECIELMGGEPLLHPEIIEFFRITRNCFKTGRVVLVTNGLLLLKMKEDFWIAAKKYNIELAPTKYPIRVDYDSIEKKAKEYGIPYYNFSMVVDEYGNKLLENYHFDIEGDQSPEDNFYNKCYRGNYCITLSHGRIYSCAIGAHLHHFKNYFGLEKIQISDENSIDIYSAKDANEIAEFLTHPMPVCKYCKLTEEKRMIPFQQTNRNIEEWL